MKCDEPLDLTSLKLLIDEGAWTDTALQLILDGATDFLFGLLGHSFGRAIRIYHDESVDATAATVEVTATQIILTITGGANAALSPYEYTLATYDEMVEIVDAIEQADVGFVVTLVEGMRVNEKSENLHTRDATSCFGLSNRQVLCIQYTTDTLDGLNEPYIFTSLPIRSVESVTQDGTAVTDYWTKTHGYLVYKYAVGSKYCKYSVDLWSVKTPCNIVVKYVPLWLRIPGVMKLALRALCMDTIEWSTYKSEAIGDYRYSKNGWSVIGPWWPILADYMISFSP